ncbi:glycoside hydrolase family 127 protein [Ruania suaedae]|uniref:glycoside hydrolase family 127 protein n=1 Tax=Ruania suaedae TaxID=2897774 RepID=UPI001E4F7954|nr:beta-L-arabinofuranosidase domain-containing protein [Ruania suaedae]UFU03712.1 glycoside hydrolase family 127 protein [Ruania suaedae]
MSVTPTTHSAGLPVMPAQGAVRPLGGPQVAIEGGFWARLQELNATTIIDHAQDWMERVGWIGNFDAAVAGTITEVRRGREFSDSDVYKLMEAMAWEIGRTGSTTLDERFRALTARIAPVQTGDGYLNTKFGRPGQRPRYSNLEWGHELYCYGHLFQAAVARLRTTGEDDFVRLALRAADHVCTEFGPDGRAQVGGHPEVETALAELARATGEQRYLDQAALFVQRRGGGTLADIELGRSYYQDDVPVREATVARGHAVRALYLAAGATDVAVDTGDDELLEALLEQARTTLARRTYLTGGMGARHTGEAFGEDYSLPPDRSYSETCAGIGAIQYFQRLLLATGDPEWADQIERILFNVVATSPAEDGRSFFYSNTLYRREAGEPPAVDVPSPRAESSMRAPWYDVSCCPTNVARTIASLDAYVATASENGLQLNQYASGTVTAELATGTVAVHVETDYPESGAIRIRVERSPDGEWTLSLRVPQWAAGTTVEIDGHVQEVEPGYAQVEAPPAGAEVVLTLPVAPRWIWPDDRIDAVRGQVAVQCGPRVYCLEGIDLAGEIGDVLVDSSRPPQGGPGDVTVNVRTATHPDVAWPYTSAPQHPELTDVRPVRLVPYHSWGNRGPSSMRVWLPTT